MRVGAGQVGGDERKACRRLVVGDAQLGGDRAPAHMRQRLVAAAGRDRAWLARGDRERVRRPFGMPSQVGHIRKHYVRRGGNIDAGGVGGHSAPLAASRAAYAICAAYAIVAPRGDSQRRDSKYVCTASADSSVTTVWALC